MTIFHISSVAIAVVALVVVVVAASVEVAAAVVVVVVAVACCRSCCCGCCCCRAVFLLSRVSGWQPSPAPQYFTTVSLFFAQNAHTRCEPKPEGAAHGTNSHATETATRAEAPRGSPQGHDRDFGRRPRAGGYTTTQEDLSSCTQGLRRRPKAMRPAEDPVMVTPAPRSGAGAHTRRVGRPHHSTE